MSATKTLFFLALSILFVCDAQAREPDQVIDLWPGLAPGEQTEVTGITLDRRANEDPPATRVKEITKPRIYAYLPSKEKRTGTAVLIFPGGAYSYVVIDKEGSEAADWLNSLGVTAFVVHYRTKPVKKREQKNEILPALSERPLQDGQRAISLIRNNAARWDLNPNQIGVLGFSAGGQLAALLTTRFNHRSYMAKDEIDAVSCRPDFSMLLYPWKLVDSKTNQLTAAFPVTAKTPNTFLVHAHNDTVTPLNSIQFYAALKNNGIEAELHIYRNGGHGVGLRPVEDSAFPTWPQRAEQWLELKGLLKQ
ncbi:MAG: alpha/beta hydrolase [Planctomycetaceae bacterium]|nr:alpha/beta hydrolase [Planctomycetaceae bacterium]